MSAAGQRIKRSAVVDRVPMLDKFAELVSQDLPRDQVIAEMGWRNHDQYNATIQRLRRAMGPQAR